MFPTFTHYTKIYPRRVVLIGFIIFALVAYLWFQFFFMARMEPVPQQEVVDQTTEVPHEMSFDEKMKILESLKNTEEDTTTEEEKMKILESLSSKEEEVTSTEEKMKILESLKN